MLKFSFSRTSRFRRVAILVSTVVAAFISCRVDIAFASDEKDLLDSSTRPVAIGRAKGIAYVDLPMRLRASFDTTYTGRTRLGDKLARPYTAEVGPRVRESDSLESRVALTRVFFNGIEIGIMCAAPNSPATSGFLDFERLTVGAMVRIVP